jgi:hypothetical protein
MNCETCPTSLQKSCTTCPTKRTPKIIRSGRRKTVTHKVKPVLTNKRNPKGYELHLGRTAWSMTRQAYYQLLTRRRKEQWKRRY